MSSTGFNRETGALLRDFEHVRQSIGVILTTLIGSRVMRREFGSELFDLIDRPMTARVMLAIYAAAAVAIARWEPRFSVTGLNLLQAGPDGAMNLKVIGTYYPRGHLGDFTPAADKISIVLSLARSA